MSGGLFEFTREEKLAAIERELVFRKRVYARLVNEKKMSHAKAREQIDLFEAIANDYRGQP